MAHPNERKIGFKYLFKVLARTTLLVFIVSNDAIGDTDCGNPFVNAYGPFDYTNYEHYKYKLPIVEEHHFTREIQLGAFEAGIEAGKVNVGYIVNNIDYTLRAFPNHHSALAAMANVLYNVRKKDFKGYNALATQYRTIECYFIRAKQFSPNDAEVYVIYGNFLIKSGDLDSALEQLKKAIELQSNNADAQYNIALVYFKTKKYDLALEHARKAYLLGFPLPYLKEQLKKMGKWDETE